MSPQNNPDLDAALQAMEDTFPTGTGDIQAVHVREFLEPLIRKIYGASEVGNIPANKVLVSLSNITETFGDIGPNGARGSATLAGNYEGTLAFFLEKMFVLFKAPSIIFFTLRGASSVIVPVGRVYAPVAAGAGTDNGLFSWSTRNVTRVTPAGLQLLDISANKTLASALPTIGTFRPMLDGFTVVEGISQRYRIQGNSTAAGNPLFFQDLTITGTVYRASFVHGDNLLNTTLWSAENLSALILTQSNTELVYDKTIPTRTYAPRSQYAYFMLDQRLLLRDGNQIVIGIGSTFRVNGNPNNDFLFRDFEFVNEFGAKNNVRIFRTGNLLNADFPIGVNV